MITRIVKLTFAPKHIDTFVALYSEANRTIKSMPGCLEVVLLRDSKYENIIYTISKWSSEEALNNYRKTDFFASTWQKTKALFCAKPDATTLYEL